MTRVWRAVADVAATAALGKLDSIGVRMGKLDRSNATSDDMAICSVSCCL